MSTEIEVRPGQVWADNDPRVAGRTLRVERLEWSSRMNCTIAVCTIVTNDDYTQGLLDRPQESPWRRRHDRRGKTTEIAVRRMRPTSTGYRLVGEAA